MRINLKLFSTTKNTLIRLAALVWFTGVLVLLFKSMTILFETVRNGTPALVAVLAMTSGLLIGVIKAKYLFIHFCTQNIKRILALEFPRIWQFYRIRFFFFLFFMILASKYAYSLSNGSAAILVPLSVLELSVSTALLLSGKCFKGNFSRHPSKS